MRTKTETDSRVLTYDIIGENSLSFFGSLLYYHGEEDYTETKHPSETCCLKAAAWMRRMGLPVHPTVESFFKTTFILSKYKTSKMIS